MFNTILRTVSYPLQCKNAKVLALPKSANEFRPISILPFISKFLNQCYMSRLVSFYVKIIFSSNFNLDTGPGITACQR